MKKVFFCIFVIFLSIKNVLCNEQTYIHNATSSDELNKVIQLNAVLDAFQNTAGKCNQFDTNIKNKISMVLSDLFLNDPTQITVKTVLKSCISETADPIQCYNCLDDIIANHNAIIKIKTTANTEYASKAQYEKELRLRGVCTFKNAGMGSLDFVLFCNTAPEKCENVHDVCKKVATEHACRLEKIYYTHIDNHKIYECGPGGVATDFPDKAKEYNYNFIPTWEDYKKLYNIK